MVNMNDTSLDQVRSLAIRVSSLERERDSYKNLSKQLALKTDEDIAFRRNLNDLLYNLDSDNIPMLNKIITYQDDYAKAIAEIRMEVSDQGASITSLVQFQQDVQAAGYVNSVQVEAAISASVNSLGGTINSYLKGNYFTQTEVNNQLITTSTNITNSITQSITQAGGSINSYLMGQFYTESEVDGKLVSAETTITNKITQDITRTGGTINLFLEGRYADKTSVASITQTVAQNAADISLLVDNGTVKGGIIISAINNETTAVINANRISLIGKNINLTSDNIIITSTYFNVDRYGNLTAASGTFTGVINANSGNIAGRLTFGSNNNYYLSGASSDTYRMYLYYSSTQYFRVTNTGILEAANGAFTGAIYANSGIIAGTLFFGNESNFYLSGTGSYRMYLYYSSTQYFRVTNTGILEAANGIFTGTINANSGNIAGRLTFGSNNNFYLSGASSDIYRICLYYSSSQYFIVTNAGVLQVANGEFSGAITANSGNILGRLTFGSNNNFYISGTDTYRIYMYNSASQYFTVSNTGVVQAANGIFTGTINATSGRIDGFLYFGGNNNYYIDGTSSATYRLSMYNSANQYFRVTNTGILEAAGSKMAYMNASYVQLFTNDGFTLIGGIYQPSDFAGGLGIMSFNGYSLMLKSAGAMYIECAAGAGISIRGAGNSTYLVSFEAGGIINFNSSCSIRFNGAQIIY